VEREDVDLLLLDSSEISFTLGASLAGILKGANTLRNSITQVVIFRG
jgi:hypothetical protein